MQYSKPPLSFESQADLLLSRGLQAERTILINRLQSVNYYRLSAYLYPFRKPASDEYKADTTLDNVWYYYTFDRQLRILVMDAIERVEVAVRTQLVYHFTHLHGAFGYLDQANLPKLEARRYQQWIEDLRKEISRSRETFLMHFQKKYGDCHDLPPLWMLCESMSFGRMLTLFNGVKDGIRRDIAHEYGIEDKILQSWLGAINVIRNICAHHGRLWNRELGYKPLIPQESKYPIWHNPVTLSNNRIFSILTILKYFLIKVAPTSQWDCRFRNLLDRYPDIPLRPMGFPREWENHTFWKRV